MSDTTNTYVFDNVEVKKTGRIAHKPLRSGKIDTVVEITPIDGVFGSWKKWVSEDTLYVVGQPNT